MQIKSSAESSQFYVPLSLNGKCHIPLAVVKIQPEEKSARKSLSIKISEPAACQTTFSKSHFKTHFMPCEGPARTLSPAEYGALMHKLKTKTSISKSANTTSTKVFRQVVEKKGPAAKSQTTKTRGLPTKQSISSSSRLTPRATHAPAKPPVESKIEVQSRYALAKPLPVTTSPAKPLKKVLCIESHNRRTVNNYLLIIKKLAKEYTAAQRHVHEEDNPLWEEAYEQVKAHYQNDEKRESKTIPKTFFGDAHAYCHIGAKPTMEDTVSGNVLNVNSKAVPFYAVFDGHGGAECAEFVKGQMPIYMAENLNNIFKSKPNNREALIDLFNLFKLTPVMLGEAFREEFKKEFQHQMALGRPFPGCTATAATILNKELFVLTVGDSRAMLSINGTPFALSEDAKPKIKKYASNQKYIPEQEKYARGALKRWGFIKEIDGLHRINGIMAPARAIGHDEEKSGMNPRPKIVKFPTPLDKLEPGHNYLIIATDGLWEVVSCPQVAKDVQTLALLGKNAAQIAEILTKRALAARKYDNVSVLVVNLSTIKLE